ncbi:MAG TPA: DUF2017 family protein [Acidimicrobiales bacterium]|nr:DUF2017 family protein [Acidimicrobiales bacterium]
MILPRLRIRRIEANRYALRLPDEEREVLLSLMPQLRDLLTMDDPLTRRIFPTAYAQDHERDREYQQLVHDDLLESRLAAIEVFEVTLRSDELSTEQLDAWMTALNSLRLVLGTRLDVGEDPPELDPDDPEAPMYAVYEYLAWMLEQAIRARSEDLQKP